MTADGIARATPFGTARLVPALLASGVLWACGPQDEVTPVPELPLVTLGDPVLEIGVLEGDDELVFGALESVVRLPDGRIAVSDGGVTRISLFEADGAFARSWGSEGDGPGEFRSLSRVYALGADSLMAAERYSGRLTVFDLEGDMGRLLPGSEVSGDSVFTLDSWLSGRFWVEGALTAAERRTAWEILEPFAVPRAWPGYRYAFATDDGAVWIREPEADGGVHTWTRVTGDGPEAVIEVPTAFRPTQVRADEVLGVWSGEAGVHFVRVYRPASTGETVSAPDWLDASAGAAAAAPPNDATPATDATAESEAALTEAELMAEIRSAIKNMASAQEIHYASNMTYTTAIDSMEAFERPETIQVDFLRADARGWAGVFSHSSIDRVCALAYGFGTPPGWMPGSVVCAPDLENGPSVAEATRENTP